jgi:hypothetical protein
MHLRSNVLIGSKNVRKVEMKVILEVTESNLTTRKNNIFLLLRGSSKRGLNDPNPNGKENGHSLHSQGKRPYLHVDYVWNPFEPMEMMIHGLCSPF